MGKKILSLVLSIAICLCFIFSAAGCSLSDSIKAEELTRGINASTLSTVSSLSESEKEALSSFSFRLFQNCYLEEDGNVLISPLSVLCALGMVENGAGKGTLSQMEKVFGTDKESLNCFLETYALSEKKGSGGLSISNSIWINDKSGLSINQDFLQKNVDFFDASVFKTQFNGHSVRDINKWVKQKTDGMIDSVINEISMDEVMYLINALTFEAEWQNLYTAAQIRQAEFTSFKNEKQKTEMLYSSEYTYLEGEKSSGFMKAYSGGKYAFAALLPDNDIKIDDFISSITGEELTYILKTAKSEPIQVGIPKLENEYSIELSSVVKSLGITLAFDQDNADFSGMVNSETKSLYINCILHKTFIRVDECGTKAGAVTAVEVKDTSLWIQQPKELIFNRPFIYMIIDLENNIPVFIGSTISL